MEKNLRDKCGRFKKGVIPWNKNMEFNKKWKVNKEFLEEEHINKNKSIRQIAKEIKIPYRTLTEYFHRFNIPIEKRIYGFNKGHKPWNTGKKGLTPWNKDKSLTKKWNITKEFLEEQHIIQKKSLRQIAREVNIPSRTLIEYAHKLNIEIRDYSNSFCKGHTPWNKGLTIEDIRIKNLIKKSSKTLKQHYKEGKVIHWSKGKTKETDERVKKMAENVYRTHWSKHLTPELSEKMRMARLSQNFPKKFTKIEVLLGKSLTERNVSYETHKNINGFTEVDIFINPNLCIYCDGDYWHANPNVYDYSKLDSNQKWHVERDKRNNFLLKEVGFKVLRFWESSIKNELPLCINKIINEI